MLRCQAAPGGRDIAMRDKGRVQNVNARLYDPGLRSKIGAGGQVADQAELGEQPRLRTLCTNEMAREIEGHTGTQGAIGGDIPWFASAAVQHGLSVQVNIKRVLA